MLRTNSNNVQNDEFRENEEGIQYQGKKYLLKPEDIELDKGGGIGVGMCGTVYKGIIKNTGECVALKTLKTSAASDREMLVKEVKALVLSDGQPNVVQWHAGFVSKANGNVLLVLELMDFGNLKNVTQRYAGKQVPGEYIASIGQQCLAGLSHLHRHKVLHRGIKPANILLNLKGSVKLTDFGIATKLDEQGHCNNRAATMIYMAPERFSKDWCAEPSDVWSLGLVMHELAMGFHPFATIGNELQLQSRIMDENPPQLTEEAGRSAVLCDFANAMLVQEADARNTVEQLLHHDFLECKAKPAAMGGWLSRLKDQPEAPVADIVKAMSDLSCPESPITTETSPLRRQRSSLKGPGGRASRKSVTLRNEVDVIEVNQQKPIDEHLNLTSDEWVSVEHEAVKDCFKHYSLAPGSGRLIMNIDGKEHAPRISSKRLRPGCCSCACGLRRLLG